MDFEDVLVMTFRILGTVFWAFIALGLAVVLSPLSAVLWLVELGTVACSVLTSRDPGMTVLTADARGGQTAYPPYFPIQAQQDLRGLRRAWAGRMSAKSTRFEDVFRRCWEGDVPMMPNLSATNGRCFGGPASVAGRIWFWGGAAVGWSASEIALGAVWTCTYGVTGIVRFAALPARALDAVQLRIRGIRMRCPHPWCFERVVLPHYECPKCRNVHEDLRPGRSGAFHRVCLCGERLPTLSMTGRYRLDAACRACRGPLPTRLGSARLVHIPLVGDTSAGKTTVLVAAVMGLMELARKNGLEVVFGSNKSGVDFDEAARLLRAGSSVLKTAEPVPSAFLMELRPGGKRRRRERGRRVGRSLVYFYDPMGESFGDGVGVRNQRYLGHVDGILFVIDPLAVLGTGLARKALRPPQTDAVKKASPALHHPMDAYDRMIADFANYDGRRKHRVPVAVVLSKADVLDQVPQWGFPEGRADLAEWLDVKAGLGNLVRSLRADFKRVTFWGVSAAADAKAAGLPDGPATVDPVLWLLRLNGLPAVRWGR